MQFSGMKLDKCGIMKDLKMEMNIFVDFSQIMKYFYVKSES